MVLSSLYWTLEKQDILNICFVVWLFQQQLISTCFLTNIFRNSFSYIESCCHVSLNTQKATSKIFSPPWDSRKKTIRSAWQRLGKAFHLNYSLDLWARTPFTYLLSSFKLKATITVKKCFVWLFLRKIVI